MVRRPLMYGTLAFASAIAACHYIGTACMIIVSALGITALMAVKKSSVKIPTAAVVFIVFYAAGSVSFCLYDALYGGGTMDAGQSVEAEGRVLQADIKEKDADTRLLQIKLEPFKIDGRSMEKKERVLVNYYVSGCNADDAVSVIPGDIILVSGVAEAPSGRRNPACFDYALYLESMGIRSIIRASELCICENSGSGTLRGRMHIIRERFTEELEQAAGKDASSMISAVMFGQKDEMDEEVLEEFQKNGTAHILAVSGLHIGIIYGFISLVWRGRKKLAYFCVVTAFFICYMAMASFTPSVVRAVIMVGLHLVANITNRRYDLASAAFAAALAMLVKNPMYLFNTGFQMSFLAVLSIAVILPFVKRLYSGIFMSGIAVQMGLAPYTAYTFNYVSLGAVFVNVPIVFITGILVPVSLCAMAAMYICEPLFIILSEISAGLCEALKALNHVTAVDGVSVFSVASPDIRLEAIYYLSMAFFMSEDGRLVIMRKRKALITAMITAVLTIALVFGQINGNEFLKADVVFVDVGQGDCIHFRTEDGRNYMIDGGGSVDYNVGKKVLMPYLLKNGIRRLDGIFVTHLHADHYKGAAELCREGMAEKLFMYEGNKVKIDEILEETGLKEDAVNYLYKGQTVRLSEKTYVEVLWPERRSDREYAEMAETEADENESSLVFKLTIGSAAIITTADVDEECQRKISRQQRGLLDCDVLKVAHHGSKYSYCDEFVKAASPDYAVFQVGKNNFGHPNQGVVENYRGSGIMIYRNDEDGAVAFDFDENKATEAMTVKKER